jgi:ribonuclease HI
MYDYSLIFDGGSRGNPGPGYGSYQLARVADGKQKTKRLEFGVHVTNNVAEYRALIAGLEDVAAMIKAAGRSPSEFTVDIRGDSKLVVEQVNGRWKVRDAGLQLWHAKAQALFRSFGAGSRLAWHDRSKSVQVLGH